MKKHKVSYHEYDDSISFHFEHCNHLKSTRNSFSQKTKKKLFFSKEKLIDQSEDDIRDIENKELLIFLEKTNSKKILKRSTSNQTVESVMKTLSESSKRLNERR
jgi:vacuolar-type H+-ATPase subunit I/STV1